MTEDWTLARVPFLRPPSQLPAPLPSERDFLESPTVFRDDVSHHRIVAVGTHFIVKHGRGVEEIEGQTLLFLERYPNASLTVPRLYAMWRIPSSGHLCLVMERIAGEDLESAWPTLTSVEKSVICAKLKTGIDHLRTIPSPGFFGGVGLTKLPYHLFWDAQGNKDVCSPFQNNSEFNAALVNKLRMIYTGNVDHVSAKAKFYEKHLGTMFGIHPPVFSHSDLQRKNILIKKSGDSMEVALVDWEAAGWYPTFWEYAIKFCTLEWTDDWPQYLEQILKPYPREAAALRMLYQDLWF
ncbi:kinase-like protein [Trematosphaeria pertusa]|uniref:Kinase-like protein n=1 Tax=Trematosphaeria pertusa TaxID=390896 RepID=A0A6A6HRQ4_9PLEO|nr:kinase-like protein [Trematosphaeria pertusa]KAF2240223.1 kinase-like protein [Trematosphaeria pertusa]